MCLTLLKHGLMYQAHPAAARLSFHGVCLQHAVLLKAAMGMMAPQKEFYSHGS